ncbi:MAG: fibronectin type III domain-containing protein, partial [Lachnospiraceae bacterium]|nr:fibronectin type III domain-containing protein [Lachnospiraceae bacterium]
MFGYTVRADAEIVGDGFEFLTCTDDSVTVHWNPETTYNGYDITGLWIENNKGKIFWEGDASQTSATITGLGKGYRDGFFLYYRLSNGRTVYSGGASVCTEPEAATEKNLFIKYCSYTKKTLTFGVQNARVSGYQIEIRTKTGKLIKRLEYDYKTEIKIQKDTIYKYRFRAYNDFNCKKIKYYGDWSPYKYFDQPSVKIKQRNNKIKVTLKKVSNVKSYTIYVADLMVGNKELSYKKVKTVK